jgi:ADP-ribose pyrophosphatase
VSYPLRFPVPDNKRPWNVPFPEYHPPYPLYENLKNMSWREPEINLHKAPQFPYGRTGITGRGVLGKWGANPAADPIITRYNPEDGKLLLLLIQRAEGEWAIPGGMVDPTDKKISAAAARELQEETGLDIDMDDAQEIYQGIVDDPRNTDNAWMTTVVFHKHLDNDTSRIIGTKKVGPADPTEIKAIRWVAYDDPRLKNLYASHTQFIEKALARVKKQIKSF